VFYTCHKIYNIGTMPRKKTNPKSIVVTEAAPAAVLLLVVVVVGWMDIVDSFVFPPNPSSKVSSTIASSSSSSSSSSYLSSSGTSTTNKEDQESVTTTVAVDDDKLMYDKQAWVNGFQNVEHESSYVLEDENFPDDLVGTFYQNGHTKFFFNNDDNEFHVHPFDADGMLSAVTFFGGPSSSGTSGSSPGRQNESTTNKNKAWFRNKYIQTLGYTKEEKAGRVSLRGVFGTAPRKGKWWANIFRLKTKNVANTHCLTFGGEQQPSLSSSSSPPLRLFALWEGGLPYEIDPVSLNTLTSVEDGKDGTDLDVRSMNATRLITRKILSRRPFATSQSTSIARRNIRSR